MAIFESNLYLYNCSIWRKGKWRARQNRGVYIRKYMKGYNEYPLAPHLNNIKPWIEKYRPDIKITATTHYALELI